LVDVVADDLSTRMSNYNRIDRKRVDFVLVDPQTGAVRKVVELDDRSHDRPDRQDRDELVDEVLGRAGIPVVRCKAQAAYNLATLRGMIEEV
jgi:very-short-patch-repair endonuclease